jgi:hypothetical protein
LVYFTK